MHCPYYLILFSAIALSSCAAIFNGTTQDVPVKVPDGTIVFDTANQGIPLYHKFEGSNKFTYLRLKRIHTYHLRFLYDSQEFHTSLSPIFDGAWMELDLFFFGIALIPDVASGALNAFDGIEIHFPNDSLDPKRRSIPYKESFDPDQLFGSPLGLVLLAGMGEIYSRHILPLFVPNEFSIGAGYDFSNKFSVMGTWRFGYNIELLPKDSKYYWDYSNSSLYQIEARYKYYGGFFVSLGCGIGRLWTDSLYNYDSHYVRHYIPGLRKNMPVGSAAIGYSGRSAYIELRYEQGFSKIIFSDGEENHFHAISLNFGFNFHL